MSKSATQPRYDGDLSVLDNTELNALARKHMAPGSHIFPRSIAGEVLKRVGEAGKYGGVAEGIELLVIGVATARIVSNYDERPGDAWRETFTAGLDFNPNTAAVSV